MSNESTAMNTWKYGRPKNVNQRNNASAYLMEQLTVGNPNKLLLLHGAFNNIWKFHKLLISKITYVFNELV